LIENRDIMKLQLLCCSFFGEKKMILYDKIKMLFKMMK